MLKILSQLCPNCGKVKVQLRGLQPGGDEPGICTKCYYAFDIAKDGSISKDSMYKPIGNGYYERVSGSLKKREYLIDFTKKPFFS